MGNSRNTEQEASTRQLRYGECRWCCATGTIQAGFIRRLLFGIEEYDCPICDGTGAHVGEWEFSRPKIWVSDDIEVKV